MNDTYLGWTTTEGDGRRKSGKVCESRVVFGDIAPDVEASGNYPVFEIHWIPNTSTSCATSPNTLMLSYAFLLFLLPPPSTVVHPR